ncbi:MAG TPA: class I SAM-dependent methyltransferase, partial [Planctomycetota bacterium]|nr:class I SAM-dependent methyltransferase [Planctomycetota bacterium]
MRSPVPAAEWFRRHFTPDYSLLYSRRDREEARREVAFIVDALELSREDRVLDLCCGNGRHLEALREHGIVGVGVDLSPWLLEDARRRLEAARRREAAEGRRALPPNPLVRADMRALPFRGAVDAIEGATGGAVDREMKADGFDAVLSLFTSFGYFDEHEEHARATSELARVLRPGGSFLVDLFHPETTVRELVPRTERRHGTLHIVEERHHDALRRRIEKSIHIEDRATGETREYFESVYVFSLEEITDLLASVGLVVRSTWGDFHGRPFGGSSPRMILSGRR